MVERTSVVERRLRHHAAPADDDRPDPATPEPAADEPAIPPEDGTPAVATDHPAATGRRRLRGVPALVLVGVVIVLAAAAVSGAVALSRPDRFGAHVDLLVDVPSAVDSNQASQLLSTQVVVVTGPSVLAPVAEGAGIAYDELEHDVTASILEDSHVVRLQVVRPNQDEAVRLVDEISRRYVDGMTAVSDVDGATAFLQEQLDQLVAQQTELRKQVATLQIGPNPDQALIEAARDELNGVNGQVSAVQEKLLARQVEDRAGPAARRLGDVRPLEGRVEPQPLRSAALGAAAGAVIAGALAVWALQRRNRSWGS